MTNVHFVEHLGEQIPTRETKNIQIRKKQHWNNVKNQKEVVGMHLQPQ